MKFGGASHETIILEAFSVKSCGSLARNARFGSFCSTGVVYGVVLEGCRSDVVSEVGVSALVRSSTGLVLCSTE